VHFVKIWYAANPLELNDFRIQASCLADFHRYVLGENSFK